MSVPILSGITPVSPRLNNLNSVTLPEMQVTPCQLHTSQLVVSQISRDAEILVLFVAKYKSARALKSGWSQTGIIEVATMLVFGTLNSDDKLFLLNKIIKKDAITHEIGKNIFILF